METPAPGGMESLLRENDLVIVDYHATWCAPCKAYSPKFQRIEREMRRAFPDAKVVFASVDIDLDHDEARRANVQSVPTTIAWRETKGLFGTRRKEVLRFSGDKSWPDLVRTFTTLLE